MTNTLLGKLEQLKELIKNDSRLVNLNIIEEELSNNEEVMLLSYKKDMASVEFSDALKHFGENSPEVKKAQKHLYDSKLSLDIHPLVKKYNEAYAEVRKLYSYINKEIFGDFAL